MEIDAWKIIERDHLGRDKTLFHGVAGSRVLARGEWIKADEKMVKDGTSKTEYLSGWHVLLNKEEAEDYLKVFTTRVNQLKIVPVKVKEIRPKAHSRKPVMLARYMKYE